MTVATRKQREKEEMRLLILEAAKGIFLEKGYNQTSIRNIASKIEYSPGTIYLYFKDKDDIFHALHEEGFRRLLEYMEPLQNIADPFERLKTMGKVYMEFARNNKDFYDLMFIISAPMKKEEHEEWEMGHHALNRLIQVLKDCQDVGRFRGLDINYLSFTIWSAMHGMCALYCCERCQAYHEQEIEPASLMDNGYRYFVAMLDKM